MTTLDASHMSSEWSLWVQLINRKILLELMTTLDGSHMSREWSLWGQLEYQKILLELMTTLDGFTYEQWMIIMRPTK